MKIKNDLLIGKLLDVYCKKKQDHRLEIDVLLEEYSLKRLSLRGRLKLLPLLMLLWLGARLYGFTWEEAKELISRPAYRRALANTFRSLREYGFTIPQKFSAPLLVVWNYTNACNLRCEHCYQKAGKSSEDELTTEEKMKVVDELSKEYVSFLAFSGGEPLMSQDFFDVAEYASRKGIYVTLATNGTLITDEIADRLVESGVKYVQISLDGAAPETHDSFRGVEGAWKRAINGIKRCSERGIITGVATTVTSHNLREWEAIFKLAKRLKADKFIVYNFIPTGRGRDIVEKDISAEEREKVLNRIRELYNQGHDIFTTAPQFARVCLSGGAYIPLSHFGRVKVKRLRSIASFLGGCGAGREYCAIQPNGDVTPCVFLPVVVGNLRESSFGEIWRESKLLNDIRTRSRLKPACGRCNYKYVCGGCRSRAYAYFGDINAPDPGCVYNSA